MSLLLINAVFVGRILLEVVGAFAILLAVWVVGGSWVSCQLDRWRSR